MKTAKKVGAIILFVLSGVFAVVGILPLLDDVKEYLPLSCFLLALAVLLFFLGRKAWRKPGETPAKEKAAPSPAVETRVNQNKTASLSIEQALKDSKSVGLFTAGNIRRINKMLLPNENIRFAVCTNVAILPNLGSLDANEAFSLKTLKDRVNGIVVISDRRIIFCGGDKTKQIALQNIQSIDDAVNLLNGQLRIIGLTEMFVLDLSKDQIRMFKQKFEEARAEATSSNGSSKNVTNQYTVSDSATELKHYAELLKDGIITQGEFEAKKKQLLGL